MRRISGNDLYLLGVIALVETAGRLPSAPKQWLVAAVAKLAYGLSFSKRRQSEANFQQQSGGKLTEAQVRETIQRSYLEFWQDTFCWRPSSAEHELLARAELIGLNYLEQALAVGKGAILLEASSFGARGWGKQVLHLHNIAVHQIHAERHVAGFDSGPDTIFKRDYLKPITTGWESPHIAEVIELPRSDSLSYTRQLLSILGRNEIVCVSGEGHEGQKYIDLPFLGQLRPFATGIVSLAKSSGAPLLPLFCIRERTGRTRIIIEPPLDLKSGSDRQARIESGLALYVARLESYIHAYPDHYRNWHFRQGKL